MERDWPHCWSATHRNGTLQTITSRSMDITKAPYTVVTIRKNSRRCSHEYHSRIGRNVGHHPHALMMVCKISACFNQTDWVENTAKVFGIDVFTITKLYPVTYNDPKLTTWSLPFVERVTERVKRFSFQQLPERKIFIRQESTGFFYFVGGMPANAKRK